MVTLVLATSLLCVSQLSNDFLVTVDEQHLQAIASSDFSYLSNSRLKTDKILDFLFTQSESDSFSSFQENDFNGYRDENCSFVSNIEGERFYYRADEKANETGHLVVDDEDLSLNATNALVSLGFNSADIGSPVVRSLSISSSNDSIFGESAIVAKKAFFFRKFSGLDVRDNRIVVTFTNSGKIVKILGYWQKISPSMIQLAVGLTASTLVANAETKASTLPYPINAEQIKIGLWYRIQDGEFENRAELLEYIAVPRLPPFGPDITYTYIEFNPFLP